jgi:type IV secretion system protein TrbL
LIFANLPHPSFDFNPAHLLPLPVIAIVNDLLSWYFFEIIFVFSCIICFVVFLSFLIAAGQLIMTLVEAYIMIGAGAVMLGFTGSRWTMSFGEKWIGYAFAIGVKLFVIYIIVALGVNIFPSSCPSGNDVVGLCSQFGQIAGTSLSIDITNINGSTFNVSQIFTAYLEIAASAIIFMMLCQRLPGLAASMMNGSPNLTAGAAIATAMQVSNAVTGVIKAGAGAAAGAAGGAGGAASLGGGGGLMEAASIDDGIGGGGTMSPAQTSLGSEATGGGFGDGQVASNVTNSSSLSNGSTGGSDAKSSVGSPVSSNGSTINSSEPGSGVGGTAVARHLVGAVSAATSPLIGFDEGGGGGSVHIGLKLPE